MPMDAATDPALPSDEFFLARQPILGRNQRLVAFELLFRSANDALDANVTNNAAATAAVISHASQLGMDQVVGERLAFVNVDEVTLMSDFVRFLPSDKVILEILETVKATPDIVRRVAELKDYGFRFALDDVSDDSEDVRKLMALVDVIKIDIKATAADDLERLAYQLKEPHKKLLAEKVETFEEFEKCLALGFEYFQGFYFARPAILTGKKIAPSEMVILSLIELINSDADNRAIEAAVKRDALISLNLLRLVNTPTAGGRGRIDTLGEAIEVLGRTQLHRWLQILLYSKPGAPVELTAPLSQMAATRGKLMELMAHHVKAVPSICPEKSFTVGIMSLMDALFSMSMRDILDKVAVPDDVRAALLERSGVLGEMLRVVELLENPRRGAELSCSLRQLGMTAKLVRDIELQAFSWVNGLAQEVEPANAH